MMTTTSKTHSVALQVSMTEAVERTRQLLHEAEHWLHATMPPTEIRFDLPGVSAGQARVKGGGGALIRYNPILLSRHPNDFIRTTVAHEVAHVVAYTVFGSGIRPHGREWQSIMHRFGVEPSRCHHYDVSRLHTRSVRRFTYRCACSTHEISSIRHNRVRSRGTIYFCRRCRQPLQPDPVMARTPDRNPAGACAGD